MELPHESGTMSFPEQLTKLVQATTGPSPWFWETFPEVRGCRGRRYHWYFHGHDDALRFAITLHGEHEPDRPRLALNTNCRPFLVSESRLGIWCPEGRQLRFACFEPDRMQSFSFDEIAGWFTASSERMYAATQAVAEFFVTTELPAGVFELQVPDAFRSIDELIAAAGYPSFDKNDPAFAIFVLYLQAGVLEVLPQNWITHVNYDVSSHWITRATRDPASHLILGELSRVGVFELRENGRDLGRWL
jgi:hypothetical protein